MTTLRWMIPAAGIVFLSLVGCNEEATEEASDTTVIEDREPDVIIEKDDDPDVIIEQNDDPDIEADIDVDDGKVEGEVKVD